MIIATKSPKQFRILSNKSATGRLIFGVNLYFLSILEPWFCSFPVWIHNVLSSTSDFQQSFANFNSKLDALTAWASTAWSTRKIAITCELEFEIRILIKRLVQKYLQKNSRVVNSI